MKSQQQNLSLFDLPAEITSPELNNQEKLKQYFTAPWFASLMVQHYFPDLDEADLILEPSAGRGALIKAIPDHVPAIGVEIDPEVAQLARESSGRQIITGDFTTVDIPFTPTGIIGNPPFDLSVFEMMLSRSYELLPKDKKAVFLLPAYFYQTAKSVIRFRHKWSMSLDMVPRDIYPGLSKPLVIGQFIKDGKRIMSNMLFYMEKVEFDDMSARSKEILKDQARRSVWKDLVVDAVKSLGGRAKLKQIYDFVSPKRPTENPFWREQIRKVAQKALTRVGHGEYALAC